jgi:hypothetical protein
MRSSKLPVVVVCSPRRSLLPIDIVDDVQLLSQGGLGEYVRLGYVSPAGPHPDFLKTFAGSERDILVVRMLF